MRSFRIELAAVPTSPARARHFVGDAAGVARLPSPVLEVLELLTSELVTNAVVHGSPPIELVVSIEERAIRVSVHDTSAAPPRRRSATAVDIGGRGLALVDALAPRWRAEADRPGPGKTVWFELDRVPVPSC